MDRLWAPWRLNYVRAGDAVSRAKGPGGAGPGPSGDLEPTKPRNFILHADQSNADRDNLVVCRTELSIVILNRYPYNNGHLLVAPRRPAADLADLTEEELLDGQLTIRRMIEAMRGFMKPDGFNVGLNLGRAAGAGLPEHLHWHIVPRWEGDTNFMTVLADERVIVQSLDELWQSLRRALGMTAE